MSEFKKRLKKLNALQEKIDSLLIFNTGSNPNPNFMYLTGINASGVFYYDFHKPKIFTSRMEFTRAKKSWIKDVEIAKIKEIKSFSNKGRIGIDKKNISALDFSKLRGRKTDVTDFLENARAIKSNYEIKQLKKSCKIATKVYEKVVNESKGLTEIELKGLIEFLMHKEGVTPSFSTIVASGSNVNYPHHEPTNRKISLPLLIDMGVRYKGYCSDITRTTGSDFDAVIEKAFEDVVHEIATGKKAGYFYQKARESLGKYAKYFTHGLGHGIGLEIHEKPSLAEKSRDVMKEGMVFTIEPGIYTKKGIRHEEDFLLTKNGAVKLT